MDASPWVFRITLPDLDPFWAWPALVYGGWHHLPRKSRGSKIKRARRRARKNQ
jgi:hypothetical protein